LDSIATVRAKIIAATTSASWPAKRGHSTSRPAGAAAMNAASTAKGIANTLWCSLMSAAITRAG
jgi:hypothetical protein